MRREILPGFAAWLHTPSPTTAPCCGFGVPPLALGSWQPEGFIRGRGSSGAANEALLNQISAQLRTRSGSKVLGGSSPCRHAKHRPPTQAGVACNYPPTIYPLAEVSKGWWLWGLGCHCVWGTHFFPTLFIPCLKARAGQQVTGSRSLLCECGAAVRTGPGTRVPCVPFLCSCPWEEPAAAAWLFSEAPSLPALQTARLHEFWDTQAPACALCFARHKLGGK